MVVSGESLRTHAPAEQLETAAIADRLERSKVSIWHDRRIDSFIATLGDVDAAGRAARTACFVRDLFPGSSVALLSAQPDTVEPALLSFDAGERLQAALRMLIAPYALCRVGDVFGYRVLGESLAEMTLRAHGFTRAALYPFRIDPSREARSGAIWIGFRRTWTGRARCQPMR